MRISIKVLSAFASAALTFMSIGASDPAMASTSTISSGVHLVAQQLVRR